MESIRGYALIIAGKISLPAYSTLDEAADRAAQVARRLLVEDGVVGEIGITPVLVRRETNTA